MPWDDRDDADASLALLSAEEADDAAADRRLRSAGEPDPEPQHRSTLLTVTPWILGNEFCERLAYYGYALTGSACGWCCARAPRRRRSSASFGRCSQRLLALFS